MDHRRGGRQLLVHHRHQMVVQPNRIVRAKGDRVRRSRHGRVRPLMLRGVLRVLPAQKRLKISNLRRFLFRQLRCWFW